MRLLSELNANISVCIFMKFDGGTADSVEHTRLRPSVFTGQHVSFSTPPNRQQTRLWLSHAVTVGVKQGSLWVHCVEATPTRFSVLVCDRDVQLMFVWPRFLSSLIKQALLSVWEVTAGDKDHTFVQSLRMFAVTNAVAASWELTKKCFSLN